MEHTLLEVAKLVLSRLELDAADRGESHYFRPFRDLQGTLGRHLRSLAVFEEIRVYE